MKVTRKQLRSIIVEMISEQTFQSQRASPDAIEPLQARTPQASDDPLSLIDKEANPNPYVRLRSGFERLNPTAKRKLRIFFQALNDAGVSVRVTSAHRYPSHQYALKYVNDNPQAVDPCSSPSSIRVRYRHKHSLVEKAGRWKPIS